MAGGVGFHFGSFCVLLMSFGTCLLFSDLDTFVFIIGISSFTCAGLLRSSAV